MEHQLSIKTIGICRYRLDWRKLICPKPTFLPFTILKKRLALTLTVFFIALMIRPSNIHELYSLFFNFNSFLFMFSLRYNYVCSFSKQKFC